MKAQIIEAITEAEKQAAYEKESAVAQAELLQREAEVRAKNTITASAGVCKAYSETQIRLATAQSEKRYEEEIEKAEKFAAEQVRNAAADSEIPVSGIVKRIVNGEEVNA